MPLGGQDNGINASEFFERTLMTWHRGIVMVLCAVLVGSVMAVCVMGQAAVSTQPAGAATTQSGLEAIHADLMRIMKEFQELLPSPVMIGDAQFRKENGAKLAPALMKLANQYGELVATQKGEIKERLETGRFSMLGYAMALGDKDAEKMLTEAAAGKNAKLALEAKSVMALMNWATNLEDAKALQKVLDDYVVVVKANPEDETVARTLMWMMQLAHANKNKEMFEKVAKVFETELKGEIVEGFREMSGRPKEKANAKK